MRFDGNELRRRHLVIGQSLMQLIRNPLNVLGLNEDECFVKIVMEFHLVQLLVDLLLMQQIEAIVFELPQGFLTLKRSDERLDSLVHLCLHHLC